jgi:subfamily B ATP-binding cassette protein MsbA
LRWSVNREAEKVPLPICLTRFYDVNAGSIAIDGTDIKDMDLHSLRSLMGLVTQDSILFNDTIKANIALGKLDATDDEIMEALKLRMLTSL